MNESQKEALVNLARKIEEDIRWFQDECERVNASPQILSEITNTKRWIACLVTATKQLTVKNPISNDS